MYFTSRKVPAKSAIARRAVFFTILALLFVSPFFGTESRTVRVGAFNFYPGIFKDTDGAIKGFYVDTLVKIGEEQNISFEYIWGSWNEGLERLKSGEVDILTSVAYTPERALFMDYGNTPILTVWSELYVSADSEIDNITAIKDKRVALMKGDFNAQNFKVLVKNFDIPVVFVEVGSFDEVFSAVAEKKAEGGVVNCTFGVARQLEYGLRSTGVVFNPFDIFFASFKGKNTDIMKMLDEYLSRWKHQESSVFNVSRQKWSHGIIGSIEVMPRWIPYASAVLASIAVICLIFIVLLRLQVRNVTSEIREREQRLRSYIENAPDGVFLVDADGTYLEANPAAEKITGYSVPEILSLSLADLQPSESVEHDMRYFQELKDNGHSNDEFIFRHKSGEKRWWAVQGVKLSEHRYLGFAKDITERKNAENKIAGMLLEKEILLKEVHHRIKNNMNTIRGLLLLQENALSDSPAYPALHDAENRVQSMIVLYDKLYCSENYRELSVKTYLETLALEIIGTFPNSDKVTLETHIDDFILNVQYLAPFGIIFNELLTNCMKHAFPGGKTGKITVTVTHQDCLVTFTLHDDGVGFSDNAPPKGQAGFGLNLVEMLSEQLDGTVGIERDDGTTFILRFKIS